MDSVWAIVFVADNTLTHAITELRNALGDGANVVDGEITGNGAGHCPGPEFGRRGGFC